jgi:hypothetical protein
MQPSTYLGHGVGLRRKHWGEIFDHHPGVDFLEILTENFLGMGGQARTILQRAAAQFPLVLHGTALSIGSVTPLDEAYLTALDALIHTIKPRWFSDHLCFSSVFGVEFHDLMPVPFTEEALEHVSRRVEAMMARYPVPFALENPSYYIEYGASEMTEATFIRRLVENTGMKLLLDVNNVWVNGQNHGYDPRAFIDEMPAEAVIQIHMAGHHDLGHVIIDTHGAPMIDPVLDLYAHTLERTGPVTTLLEWDNDLPDLAGLLAENDRARAVAEAVVGKVAPCR